MLTSFAPKKHFSLRNTRKSRLTMYLLLSLCLMLFNNRLAKAQIFTQSNDEYDITQYKVDDDSRFNSGNTNPDPTVNLTMDCLAANGYGQWTVSSDMGSHSDDDANWIFSPNQIPPNSWTTKNHSSGWFLLSNILAQPSERFQANDQIHHPGCQPPGIVSGGMFNETFPATPKVTTNLNGSVRYVWIDPGSGSSTRVNFFVEGLNDERGGTSADQQISIALNGLPNPVINRQIVKKPIFSYNSASTGGHPVIGSNAEPDYHDQFDIASDKNFLYIVWCTVNSGTKEIWATVIKLSDGTVTMAPSKVSITDIATRPTVACDIRNAPINPQFDVAYITSTGSVVVREWKWTVSSSTLDIVSVGAVSHTEVLPKTFYDPFTLTSTIRNYGAATHARIIVSYVAGTSSALHSIFVLDDLTSPTSSIAHDLIFCNNLTWNSDVAKYVDGAYNNALFASYTSPLISSTNYAQTGVVDRYITAFANPYDNENGNANQFHCLYQPVYTNGTTITPLVLVRGCDNNFRNAGAPDTRILLSQDNAGLQPSPNKYVGAVNQMGIHVHWRNASSPASHYYARDERTFDEYIEERTLVTNNCTIQNGTAHGGLNGAAILGGNIITIWTDPNYGASPTDLNSGLYEKPTSYQSGNPLIYSGKNMGSLGFKSNGAFLKLGDYQGDFGAAKLYSMPNCFIYHSTNSTATINVYPTSTWEFYGSPSSSDFQNEVTVNVLGFVNPYIGLLTANLRIHGGSQFFGCNFFSGNLAKIDILNETSIFPLHVTTTTTNIAASGLFTSDHQSEFNHSEINSFIETVANIIHHLTLIPVINISGSGSANSGINSFTSNYTNYTNTGSGFGVISFNTNSIPSSNCPNKAVFNYGTTTRFNITARDPRFGLSIEHMTFTECYEAIINLYRDDDGINLSRDYENINLTYNTFSGFSPAAQNQDVILTDNNGILISNFNNTNDYENLIVDHNTFFSNALGTGFGVAKSAIQLINSTGNITHNTISDHAFLIGIWCHSYESSDGLVPFTYAYLCNNYISSLTGDVTFSNGLRLFGTGIQTDYYQGYIKLCQINGCQYGLVSGKEDKAKLVWSSIQNCRLAGIYANSGTSKVDLSGIHSLTQTGAIDYAAYDTIKNNGYEQILLSMASPNWATIYLGNDLASWTWINWGENNIIGQTSSSSNLYLIRGDVEPSRWDIGNIDRNFWGTGNDPAINSNNLFYEVDFTANSSNTRTSLTIIPARDSGNSCSGQFALRHINDDHYLIASLQWGSDSCKHLYAWSGVSPSNEEEFQMQYDTLRHFIESCPMYPGSYRAFQEMDADQQRINLQDTTRYKRYREWLISVLYLNPDYFCNCLNSIAGTYSYDHIPNAGFAVLKFLLDDSICYNKEDEVLYNSGLEARHKRWLLGDTTIAEDTTLPSLDKIGLGFLTHSRSSVSPSTALPTIYLASFGTSPNPFNDETTLSFELNRMAYITVEVFDPLGRKVWDDDHGYSLDKGIHTVHLDGTKLSSGTYYARISTGFGEVKTVKVIKE